MDPEARPVDGAARALFAAARRELPRQEIRERTLAAMVESRRARPVRPRFGLPIGVPLLLAAAALAGLIALTVRGPALSSIAPERWLVAPRGEASAAVSSVPSADTAHPAAPEARERPTPRERPRTPRPAASLADEVAALDRARVALDGGDSRQALQLLDAYDRAGARRLAAEATVLRIEALAGAGKSQEASALAQEFVAANPGSPLVDRARRFLDLGSP